MLVVCCWGQEENKHNIKRKLTHPCILSEKLKKVTLQLITLINECFKEKKVVYSVVINKFTRDRERLLHNLLCIDFSHVLIACIIF